MIISYKGVTPLGLFHIHIFAPPHIIVCCQPIELRLCCNRRYISLLMLANCRNTYSCKHPIIESIKVLDRVLSLLQKTPFHSHKLLILKPSKYSTEYFHSCRKHCFIHTSSLFSNHQSTRPSTFTLPENTVSFKPLLILKPQSTRPSTFTLPENTVSFKHLLILKLSKYSTEYFHACRKHRFVHTSSSFSNHQSTRPSTFPF
jgi:hypothetical protein